MTDKEEFKIIKAAAEQGCALAQNYLGICYYLGKGVEKDYNEAVKWIGLAAQQGDAEAQENLNFFKNKVNHE